MLRNHLKVAYRSILKRKEYTFINILGLTLGITAAILIWQYVALEKSYDSFHSKADRIYRLPIKFFSQNTLEVTDAMNYAPTGPTMKEELPEVEEFVRITPEYGRVVLAYEDKKFEESKIFYADSTLFNVFDFPLLEGDEKTCLANPWSILLTQTVAERYFGKMDTWRESPVGKAIRFNQKHNMMITGIIEDTPENSHIKFGALISFTTFLQFNDPSDNWGWNDFYTYVQLKEGVTQQAFEAKIPDFIARHIEFDTEGTYDEFLVQPLSDIHLKSKLAYEAEANGDAKTVAFLLLIGFVILIIAWVNYINLATARAEERSQEVGVRKVVGASQGSLIVQFLTESFILNGLALLLAFGFIQALGPLLSSFLGRVIPLSLANLPFSYFTLPFLLVAGTLLAGLYPAFILSTFTPVDTLKGSETKKQRGIWLRKSLVVFQYAAALILVVGTLIIQQQLKFMQQQDLGFSIHQTLVLNAPSVIENDSIYQQRYTSFKNELGKYPNIQHITSSSAIPGKNFLDLSLHGPLYLVGSPKEKGANFSTMQVEESYMEAYEMNLLAGRFFSKEMKTDKNALIVNETALNLFGLTDGEEIIGKQVQYWDNELPIVGVVEDYHHKSLKNAIEPMILMNSPGGHLYYSVKFDAASKKDIQTIVDQVQTVWASVYPENPFNFFFLDNHFNEQYIADNQLSKIISLFSGLIIFIACMGLFGLASYHVSTRAKEISIRKILGASTRSILMLFSKDYLQLLGISFIIGIPLAYYFIQQWLNSFAFATRLNFWIFILPCIAVLLIAFVAVSSQSFRAATRNPVDALGRE